MRQITVAYHHEAGSWWAESANVPEFSAAAETLTELRALVREGIDFALDGADHLLVELPDGGSVTTSTSAAPGGFRVTVPTFSFKASRKPEATKRTNSPRLALT